MDFDVLFTLFLTVSMLRIMTRKKSLSVRHWSEVSLMISSGWSDAEFDYFATILL